ncbi:WD repeat-containing protein 89 [Erpetoichthys calabaricus]|uniref:WD repeat-containing protein 89 n=1 Tax=Erpetoichthys calabaricus TaxID=27687 RepID=A0A8C4SSE8_ERPCA|nr:WD repeat-containing protein 89 [Erpetoichthys calabaricus]
MEDFEKQFATLSIAKRSKSAEDPTYMLHVDCQTTAVEPGSQAVAVACSNLSVCLYNKQTLRQTGQYLGHSGPICGVRFSQTSGNLLYSASSDGTIRCWDVRTPGASAVHIFKSHPSHVFTSFDINCEDQIICAGTDKVLEDSYMVFWDVRASRKECAPGGSLLGVYSESHNDDITQICFHPSNKNFLLSGSVDGLVNVFDVAKDTEDSALLATCNLDSSVSFTNWAGETYQIYCLSHDEAFALWDLAQLDTEETITLLKIEDARESTKIPGSHLDYLIGGLYHEQAKKLVIVGGTNTGKIHLLECCKDGLKHMCSLENAHSSVVRCLHWDTQDHSLLTGGEDAQLFLWRPGAVELSVSKKESLKSPSSVQQQTRVHNKMFSKKRI